VRRGCMRISTGTAASALGGNPLAKLRGHVGCLPNWLSSFSQITSTGLVVVEEMELCEASSEKTEEEEEEAEEEIEEA
jgi:hypothetical protein